MFSNTYPPKGVKVSDFVLSQKIQIQLRNDVAKGESGGYHFPLLLRSYFNLCFCLLISPFYISEVKVKGHMEIKSFIWHKVLCGVLHLAGCISYILNLRLEFASANIRSSPELLYDHLRETCVGIYTLLFLHLLWFHQKTISTLISNPVVTKAKRSGKKLLIMNHIMVVGILAEIGRRLVDHLTKAGWSFEKYLDKFGTIVLKAFFFRNNGDSGELVVFHEISLAEKIITYLGFFGYYYITLIAFFSYFLVFLGANAVNEIVQNAVQDIERIDGSLKGQLGLYSTMKREISKINKLVGPILVIVLVDMINFWATALGRPGDGMVWYAKVLILIVALINTVGMTVAAEGNHIVTGLENRLVHNLIEKTLDGGGEWTKESVGRTIVEVQGVKALVKSAPGQDGLAGWKFFKVSYSFLGTVISVCFTYALVMLQLVATPKV